MKKILLLTLSFVCLNLIVKSSHITGGHIYYEYVGPNQYKVTLKLYIECNAPPASSIAYLCVSSINLGDTLFYILTDTSSIEIIQNHCTPGLPTNCNGGLAKGVKEYTYSDTITLPAAANDWTFSWSECCRNAQITTLSSAGGHGIYIHAILDNLNYSVNSSPVFNFPAIIYFCQYVSYQYDCSATDADGDSLIYSFANPREGSGCPASSTPIMFALPYSVTNQVASTPPSSMTSNGIINFTPTLVHGGVFCMKVEEYGNGVKIGEVISDVMFIIEPNTTGIEETNSFPFEIIIPDESQIELLFSDQQHAVQISLTDQTGRKIISSDLKKGNDKMILELPETAAGIYFLNVYCNEEVYSRKIVFNNN